MGVSDICQNENTCLLKPSIFHAEHDAYDICRALAFPGEQACDSPAVPVGHLPPKSLDLQSDLAGRVDIPCSWIVIIPNILNI